MTLAWAHYEREFLRAMAERAVAPAKAQDVVRGIFNDKFLPMLLRLHQEDAAAYYGELVWILTALELWLQSHAPSTRF